MELITLDSFVQQSKYWTIGDAVPLITTLQPLVKPLGYHVALGGGVLNKGYSLKDLDLYFLPLDNPPTQPEELQVLLTAHLGEQYPLGYGSPNPNYGPHPTYRVRATFIREDGARTDVFII